jgi:acetyltransferase-like isoleucine patch superfamily enzyme
MAGISSQVWTHGYNHAPEGPARFRIDGSVNVGSNVYIGSSCVINAGVKINDSITVGSHACVSKSLQDPGLYVSQPLRLVKYDYQQAKNRYPSVKANRLVEYVVVKK